LRERWRGVAAGPALDGAGRSLYNERCSRTEGWVAMHARVSSYQGDVDRLVEGFRRQTGLVRRLDGFARAYLFVDRSVGRAVTVTLWDSEEALDASASRAAQLREEARETAAATIGSVDSYEVAFDVERAAEGLT
jgi:heme-degrading monooxygenase HmoA